MTRSEIPPAQSSWSAAEAADIAHAALKELPAMIGYWDRDLRNRLANDAYVRFFGKSPDEMPGMHLRDLLGPDLFALNLPFIERALAGEAQLFDREIVKPDGGVAFTQASYIPDTVDGVVRGFFVLVTDITERHRIEAELHASEARYRALAEQLPGAAITVVGSDLRLQWFGGRVSERDGVPLESMIGTLVRDAAGGGEHGSAVEDLYRRAIRGERISTELHSRVTGRSFAFEAAPLRAPDGEIVAALGVAQDITERKRAEAELKLRSRIINSMAEGTLLIRERDLTILDANRTLETMFGYSPGELVGKHVSILNAGGEEGPQVVARRVLTAVNETIGPWTGSIHSVRKDGSTFWRRSTISMFEEGDERLLVSVVSDVTEQRQRDAEEAALTAIATLTAEAVGSREVLDAIAEHVLSAFDCDVARVIRYDPEASLGHVAASSATRTNDEPTALNLADSSQAAAAVWTSGRPARSTPKDALQQVAAPVRVAGTLWGCITADFHTDDDVPPNTEHRLERFTRLLAISIANAEAWEALRSQAGTDHLTGLANFRTFHDRLADEYARASRYGRDLSLALIDLDEFKAINDTYGHQQGDAVLKAVAAAMADATRGEDLVARIGGDEFAWLMPETSDDSAREAVERLRTKIASRPFGNVGMVTFSAGISSISGTDDTETLVREADAALYAAKQAGRDTAVVHRTARPENPAAATSLIAS